MRTGPVVAVTFAVLAGAIATAGQLPPRDVAPNRSTGGIIRGVITAAENGQPIRGAEVRLRGGTQPNQAPHGAMTDAMGRYEVTGLPAGQYTVTASKTGYVALAYGQTRVADPGRPVEVTSDAIENIDVALPRGAVIVVRIADEFGDPAPGYRITAFQPRFTDGRRTLAAVQNDVQGSTDDRGELRLSGLAPGEYYVAASVNPSPVSPPAKAPQTFYPGTASETDAQPVTVALGEEIGVSFPLATARGARISGVVEGAGRRLPTLRLERRTLGMTTIVDVNLSPDGRFTASNLVPAEYVITALGETETGLLRFRVSGEDLEGLVLTMRRQAPLRGRFTFDTSPPSGPAALATSLRPVTTDGTARLIQPVAQVKTDWSFDVPYAFGIGVLRFDSQPRGWFLKAIRLDGVDVTDTPMDFSTYEGKAIDVQLTQRATKITGTVLDSRGAHPATYVVVLFPGDPQQWTTYSRGIVAARPDQKGSFVIEGVPPGRYQIAVVEYLEPGQEREPATLERLRRGAMAITLGDAESKTIELKLAP
jgi:hypothetical protein